MGEASGEHIWEQKLDCLTFLESLGGKDSMENEIFQLFRDLIFIDFHGFSWISMDFQGFSWIFIDFHGFS